MFQANQQIGGYTLFKQIRRSDIGEIWLGRIITTSAQVVMQLFPDLDHPQLDTIHQEAVIWKQGRAHKNILPLIEVNSYDGQLVIVSDYLEDHSLAEILRSHTSLPLDQAIKILIEMLDGLDHLHRQGIFHRRLNPHNIFLQKETLLLTNFSVKTTDSIPYLAPEALNEVYNVQTDIWSAGVILYQLLSGNLPFSQEENMGLEIMSILTRDFSPLPDEIPIWLKEITGWALSKKTENRYQSAAAMRSDLKRFFDALQDPAFKPIPRFFPSSFPALMYPGALVVGGIRSHTKVGGSTSEVTVAFNPTETVVAFYEEKFGKGHPNSNGSVQWRWEDNLGTLQGYKMISVYPESSISLFTEQHRQAIPANTKTLICFESSHW